MTVRRARETDWARIGEICCRTGEVATDRSRWPEFVRRWVEPYRRLRPEWTFVAEVEGEVGGYLTGCPDTTEFDRAKIAWPARALARRPLHERRFSAEVRGLLARDYPAHLHMNLDERFRRGGLGRALISAYFGDLSRAGIRGCHLFCGPGPLGFYLKAGFRELARIELRPAVWVHVLAARVP
jgi:GNAT superfamily N-acetyltransferase